MPWTDKDKAEVEQRKAATDKQLVERHRMFDLQTQDNHAKYERPSFIPNAGTGDRESNETFRRNYDLIDWSK